MGQIGYVVCKLITNFESTKNAHDTRSGEPHKYGASISNNEEMITRLKHEITALENERNRRAITFDEPSHSQDSKPHHIFRALSEGDDQLSVTRYRHIKWWRSYAEGSTIDDNEIPSFQSFCDYRDDESDKSNPSDITDSNGPESTAPTTALMTLHSDKGDHSDKIETDTDKKLDITDAVDPKAIVEPFDRKQDIIVSSSKEDSPNNSENSGATLIERGFSPVRITWKCVGISSSYRYVDSPM